MKDMNEVITELASQYDELRAGRIDVPTAKELSNTAGKVINAVRLQLEFYALTKQIPVINFLGSLKDPKIAIEEKKKILK